MPAARVVERLAQLPSELSATEPGHPFQRPDRALAGGHCEGQKLCHRGKLGRHPLLARAYLVGQPAVTGQHSGDGRHQAEQQQRQRRGVRRARNQHQHQPYADQQASGSPDDLLDPELLHGHRQTGLLDPPLDRTRTAQHSFDQLDGITEDRPQQPFDRRKWRDHTGSGDQTGRPRGVVDVGPQPAFKTWPTKRRRRPYGQHNTGGGASTEHRASSSGRHRSTLASVGSRRDTNHHPVGDERQGRANEQNEGTRCAVVGADSLRPQRQQAEHQPGCRQRQPRRVDRPALTGLELGSGTGILAQEGRQRAQEPAEVTAADLAGHADATR